MKTIRNNQIVWPYCDECGCRLSVYECADKYIIEHFYFFDNKADMRGCICSKLSEEWSIPSNEFLYI